ncbi:MULTISPECIES: alpha-ketoglutarate-dependent dioxygenase AlkB [unclassified Coleofasciculus]|uniref:alpha-ketoglutarate-dependent dioxygenase AlkB family protein n=1 Tax=Cyanophyceae TaxID=3028117 RepID=UPI001F5524C1|nr:MULTISPECIES: alpha-ketoglutarate-dependent dioxygenase AlkB [unclassified Coleofasciculus]
MPDAEVTLYCNFFDKNESDKLYSQLYKEIHWRQEKIKLYGKELNIPRLTAWHGDSGKSYTYSKIPMSPEPWTPTLFLIKSRIESLAGISFNSVLLNLYRNGNDSVAWHSDDEPELGEEPVIGSVSFGGTRRFMFRHKVAKEQVEVELTHGSLLVMQGTTQQFWQHQIPKTSKRVEPRINLTFRVIH